MVQMELRLQWYTKQSVMRLMWHLTEQTGNMAKTSTLVPMLNEVCIYAYMQTMTAATTNSIQNALNFASPSPMMAHTEYY